MTLIHDASARVLTVASVPAGHVYVRHLEPLADDHTGTVRRLPDPPPRGATGPAGGSWWPPAMLDAAWIEAHAATFDVLHVHFGFDALEPAELRQVVDALRRHRVPLVYTVHDLRNPHHGDRTAHDAHLDVLVPSADALVTLTPGAAAEIKRRWGREAVVVPHPHVVPFETMRRARAMRETGRRAHDRHPFRVGVHLKSLRASMAPERVVPTLVDTVAGLPDAVLQVDVHRDVLEPSFTRHDADLTRLLRTHADAGRIDLRVHDYFSDDDLFDYLASLDVSVLPYRFGTHSGWLEACRDLGTTVVAPTCGYYSQQGLVRSYVHDEDRYVEASLTDAVTSAWADRRDLGTTVEQRRRQRRTVAAVHERIYREVTA